MLKTYVGYYLEMKFRCEAEDEAEAQEKLKEVLIEKLREDEAPFCVFRTWEEARDD